MQNVKELKQKAQFKEREIQNNLNMKIQPIVDKYFNENESRLIKILENDISKFRASNYKHFHFTVLSMVTVYCKLIGIADFTEVVLFNEMLSDKLITVFKKKGYLFALVYNSDNRIVKWELHIFWNKLYWFFYSNLERLRF